MSASQASNPKVWEDGPTHGYSRRHVEGGTEAPVYPVPVLGSRRERMGQLEHATYIILFESSILNTGEPERDGKESGK